MPEGRQVVLVIDALDEAADWEVGADLFPNDPPPGLRVLVTARYRPSDVDARSWMGTLGWNDRLARRIELPPLSQEGLREVILSMGAPLDQLVTDVDVVGELYRLTEGDPLLARLYVDDLWILGSHAPLERTQFRPACHPGARGHRSGLRLNGWRSPIVRQQETPAR